MSERGIVDVRELIGSSRFGRVRIVGVLLCAVVVLFDGFDLQIIGLAAPSMAKTMNLPASALGEVFSAAVAGLAAGSLVLAPWSDRFGRKAVLVPAVVVFAMFTLATPAAGTLAPLLAYRFVTGLGLGAAVVCAVTLASEFVGPHRRGVIAGALYTGFPLGGVLAGLLGSTLIAATGWQSLFIVGAVGPLVTAVLLIAVLPESLTFLVGKQAPRERIRRAMERIVPDAEVDPDRLFAERRVDGPGMQVGRLFTDGRRLATVLLWTVSFVAFGILVINSSWVPTLLAPVGLSVSRSALALALFNAASMIATAAGGWLVARVGAGRVMSTACVVAAVGLGGVGLVVPSALGVAAMEVLVGLGLGCASSGVIALAAAAYPTALRSTGLGWTLGLGRIGSFVGPLLIGTLATMAWRIAVIFGVLSAACLVGAVAALALRTIAE